MNVGVKLWVDFCGFECPGAGVMMPLLEMKLSPLELVMQQNLPWEIQEEQVAPSLVALPARGSLSWQLGAGHTNRLLPL